MFIYKNKTNVYSFLIPFFFYEARLSTDQTNNKLMHCNASPKDK